MVVPLLYDPVLALLADLSLILETVSDPFPLLQGSFFFYLYFSMTLKQSSSTDQLNKDTF